MAGGRPGERRPVGGGQGRAGAAGGPPGTPGDPASEPLQRVPALASHARNDALSQTAPGSQPERDISSESQTTGGSVASVRRLVLTGLTYQKVCLPDRAGLARSAAIDLSMRYGPCLAIPAYTGIAG